MPAKKRALTVAFVMALTALAAAMAFSCTPDAGKGDGQSSHDHALVRCKNCDEVQTWIQDVMTARITAKLQQNLQAILAGADMMPGGPPASGDDTAAMGDETDDTDQGNGRSGSAACSETNGQEPGVDEADILKANEDGTLLFLLAGGDLIVFDSKPAETTHEISRLAIEGEARGMFVRGDKIIVFSEESSSELPRDIWPDVPHAELAARIFIMTIVDARNPGKFAVLRTVYSEGAFLASRMIGSLVHTVISTYPTGPALETRVDPAPYLASGVLDAAGLRRAYQDLLARDVEAIQGASLSAWLPRYFQAAGGEMEAGFLTDCRDFFHPAENYGRSVTTLLTVDLNDPLARRSDIALLADGSVVYASADTLYLAGGEEAAMVWLGPGARTSAIHKFSLGAGQARYIGSGAIDGFVLNQFSMSESDGFLRVAASDAGAANSVQVLRVHDGELRIVGSLSGLAPGRRLSAARFLGSRGYLVTGRRADPFITLDLSDPIRPRVAGMIEVPGYSTYIHPLDDSHILTLGMDDNFWTAMGVQLQMFDVSDFAHPSRLFSELVSSGFGATSEALFEHQSFFYYAPGSLLALPVASFGTSSWANGDADAEEDDDHGALPLGAGEKPPSADDDAATQPHSGVNLYRVSPKSECLLLGKVDHTKDVPEDGSDPLPGPPAVHRSLILGDDLFTVSEAALVVTRISPFEEVLRDSLPYKAPGSDSSGEEDWNGGVWADDDWTGASGDGSGESSGGHSGPPSR